MTLTFGSLFAGIGGFDLGLERAGMVSKWQVEIDDYCTRVLEKHWPDVKRYRDVRKIHGAVAHAKKFSHRQHKAKQKGREITGGGSQAPGLRIDTPCPSCLEPVDLICGGFPCQPHSYAGKRKGAADDRDLWPEFKRIIDELRPRWVLAENVPGIRTTILDTVLSDLEGMGYAWEAAIIPACAVDAPHRRDRVWIVAHSDSNRSDSGQRSIEGRLQAVSARRFSDVCNSNASVADANSTRLQKRQGKNTGRTGQNGRAEFVTVATRAVESRLGRMAHGLSRWLDEPDGVPRVATGIPDRVNRLKALGNAVVPQVVEFIGRLIVEADNA